DDLVRHSPRPRRDQQQRRPALVLPASSPVLRRRQTPPCPRRGRLTMARSHKSLEEAIETFDRAAAAEHAARAEAVRAQVLERFPLDAWPTLPIERYALGTPQSAESYCKWVEFQTPELGSIKGGSAGKLLIYFDAKAGAWRY